MTNTTDNTICWPNGAKFVVCLTHDVDRVKKSYQYFTRFLYHSKKLRLMNAVNEIINFFKHHFDKDPTNNPYWNFERIMEIERKHGVKSTFFFLNERKKVHWLDPSTWKLYLGRYSLTDLKIVETMEELRLGGWEIGLHGSYSSYVDKNLLRQEKKELEDLIGAEIYGVRQHYLNLEIPLTWKFHEDIGLRYDMSLRVCEGKESGRASYLPLHPLNSPFLEIPLAIMDCDLFRNRSMVDAWLKCEAIIKEVEKQGGVLTILWHQRVFNEEEFPGWSNIYEKIIIACKEKGAWITTGEEFRRWWMEHAKK